MPWAKARAAAEKHLRERCDKAGVKWTSLRATGSMSTFLPQAPAIQKGFLPQTSGNGRIGLVSVDFRLMRALPMGSLTLADFT